MQGNLFSLLVIQVAFVCLLTMFVLFFWQKFYEFMTNVSGIPNFSLMNSRSGIVADALICEVSPTKFYVDFTFWNLFSYFTHIEFPFNVWFFEFWLKVYLLHLISYYVWRLKKKRWDGKCDMRRSDRYIVFTVGDYRVWEKLESRRRRWSSICCL